MSVSLRDTGMPDSKMPDGRTRAPGVGTGEPESRTGAREESESPGHARITKTEINRAIDYIWQHMDDEIRLSDVAAHCNFSVYYFCRLFKSQTGESVYGFIRRLKLEQSAFRLKTERERPITEIGADCGYSSSNYSSAFRKRYLANPAMYRKHRLWYPKTHPVFKRGPWELESFEECSRKIHVETLPDYHVIYERYHGSYGTLAAAWDMFLKKYQRYAAEDALFMERTYDDPSVTEPENCIYDIYLGAREDCRLENTMVIRGGRCAVYHFAGHVSQVYGAYQSIFLVWLPKCSLKPDAARPPFDIYHRVDRETMYMELDICVPLLGPDAAF